jgi:hypothetical protein
LSAPTAGVSVVAAATVTQHRRELDGRKGRTYKELPEPLAIGGQHHHRIGLFIAGVFESQGCHKD